MPSKMDHIADIAAGGVELHRLAKIYDFPDFVKSAGVEVNLAPSAKISVTAYADPPRSQFPCHTKASTWLSYLYFQEKRGEFHPSDREQIERRFKGYIKYYAIKAACDAVKQRWTDLHKTAEEQLPDSAYAYVWVGDNGVKDRRLPLRNAVEVKVAADYLLQHRDTVPLSDRRTMAVRILEKAAAYGAAIGERIEFLEQQAGRGVCDPREVVAMLRERALLVPETLVKTSEDGTQVASLRDHFNLLADTVEKQTRQALHPSMLEKLANTVDQLDRTMNLSSKYARGLVRPEEVIFRATFAKAASELQHNVSTTSGRVYERAAFKKLAATDLRALFGDDFAKRVTTVLGEVDAEKMAEEVATLPRPDAELLDSLLSDNGIAPIMRKAASAGQGLTKQEMAAWSAAYRA